MAELKLSMARFAAPFDFDTRVRQVTSFYQSEGYQISLDTDLQIVRVQKADVSRFSTMYNLVCFDIIAAASDAKPKPKA